MSLPFRIVTLQLLTALVMAGCLLIWDSSQAAGALLAGVVCVVPAGYFAWRVKVERSASRVLLQGVLKFVLTVVLMAACIVVFKPPPAGFFGTFMLLQVMYVVGPLFFSGPLAPFFSGPQAQKGGGCRKTAQEIIE